MSKSNIPPKQKLQKTLNVIVRDGNKCVYCEKGFKNRIELTLDHVVPRKHGGTNAVTNLAICCIDCNSKKASMLLTEFIRAYDVKINKTISNFL